MPDGISFLMGIASVLTHSRKHLLSCARKVKNISISDRYKRRRLLSLFSDGSARGRSQRAAVAIAFAEISGGHEPANSNGAATLSLESALAVELPSGYSDLHVSHRALRGVYERKHNGPALKPRVEVALASRDDTQYVC